MAGRFGVRGFGWVMVCGVALCGGWVRAEAPLKKQLPADERAFKAARAVHDPERRLEAMRGFVKAYPKSGRVGQAEDAILTVLLKSFPERTGEIDRQAKLVVEGSDKGSARNYEETYVAFELAEAGTNGVDLKRAEKLAGDPLKHLDEATFDKATSAAYVKYKVAVPKPAEMHADFANTRADALAVLANVELREGRKDRAAALAGEAYALDPTVDDVNTMRGRLALAGHDDAGALDAFERAQLLGSISPADRTKMMELYRAAHGGSDADFEAAMDARYPEVFPATFQPPRAEPVTGGHTVLVELFTGSGCAPCVAADLAVEKLLEAYPRSEVVALAFDQHIPEPDPLSNPDSVARAGVYDLQFTPTYVVDGRMREAIPGGRRTAAEGAYGHLTKVVDAEAGRSTGVQLVLSAGAADGGRVRAEARVTLPSASDLEKALAAGAEAVPALGSKAGADKAAGGKTAPVVAAAPVPEMVVNFALVEDDVRYSGENGIRFHRMVVRSLAKPAASGFPVEAGATATVDASFDPAAISEQLHTYLDEFAKGNERFGTVKFLMTDTTIKQRHLAVAAWVQDVGTHRVLASALMPVGDGAAKGAE